VSANRCQDSGNPWEFRPFLAERPDVAWQVLETMARRIADSPQP
jgi:hypothetical protein